MATANPIEDLLSTDIDESEVSAFVGSLESRLASPTHKDISHQITDSSVNSNHISNVLNVSTATCSSSSLFTVQGQKGLQSHGSPVINSLYGANVKSDSQLLGIPSILNSTNATGSPGGLLNITALNSTPNKTNTRAVNSSGNIMLVAPSHTPPLPVASHTPPHVNVGPNGNLTFTGANNRASPQNCTVVTAHNNTSNTTVCGSGSDGSKTVSSSAMYNLASIAAEQKPLAVPTGMLDIKSSGANNKLTVRDQLDKKPNISSLSGSPSASKHQIVVKQESRHVKQEPMQQSQPSSVHIVNATSKGIVSNTSGSHNVITVSRPAVGQGGAIVRPQIITTQTTHANGAQQMTVVPRMPNATNSQPKTVQTTRINAPIRIAAAPQINIAPRPGTNTITLPPGLHGTIMMKNEQGQIVFMSTGQHGGIPTQQTSTSALQGKVNIQTIKSQARPAGAQTVVAIQQQTGATTLHPHGSTGTPPHQIASAHPGGIPTQTIVQSPVSTPGATAAQGPSLTPGASAVAQQQAMEHVKKCKNFLSTLIKLASSQPPQTIRNVRELIQRLIDGKVEPEQFTENLQVELNSSPQPNLVPFLKKSLPLLRQSLSQNKMTIEGVKAPPPSEVLQGSAFPHSSSPVSISTRPHIHQQPHTIQSPHTQVKHIVRQLTPQQLSQIRSQKPVSISTGSPVPGQATIHTKVAHGKTALSGAMPTTVSALQARVGGKHQDAGGGAQHKEKRKFESLKDADDDINDVATMGGVNLSEESKNILATNADFIGTHIRSCKDELFLNQGPLLAKISSIAKKYGVTDIPADVISLVSQATQERLRNIAERLSTIAEHRTEIYRMDSRFEVTQDTKTQLKFLEEIDKLEKKRHEEQEREILLRAAKSRSKTEDPEQAKLKQKAKELQLAEAEELRQQQANQTALAAIGPRKKKKLDTGEGASTTSLPNGVGNTPSRAGVSNRPRIKRVNLKDLIFLMEQEKDTRKSTTLYKAFLK